MNDSQKKRLAELHSKANTAASKYGEAMRAVELAKDVYTRAHHAAQSYEDRIAAEAEARAASDTRDDEIAARFTNEGNA